MRRQISLALLTAFSALTVAASAIPSSAEAKQDRYCLQGRQWGYPGNWPILELSTMHGHRELHRLLLWDQPSLFLRAAAWTGAVPAAAWTQAVSLVKHSRVRMRAAPAVGPSRGRHSGGGLEGQKAEAQVGSSWESPTNVRSIFRYPSLRRLARPLLPPSPFP